jgi:fructosamine-3-kinase
MTPLAEAGACLLGGVLQTAEPLHGGDLSALWHITLQDGRQAVVKNGQTPRVEADMLHAIKASGAPAPAVLQADDSILVIEYIPAGGPLAGAWASLGYALATLHRAIGPRYGWQQDYAFGAVAIENAWSDDWPDFFAQRRLLSNLPHIPPALGRRIEALAGDLGNRLPRRPPAALLHGDCWGGNLLVRGQEVVAFIDPACCYGHAEVDIAMLGLFDRPAAGFHAAYGPLEPGHAERLAIYRLWPALVHLRLFGEAYRGQVESCLASAHP